MGDLTPTNDMQAPHSRSLLLQRPKTRGEPQRNHWKKEEPKVEDEIRRGGVGSLGPPLQTAGAAPQTERLVEMARAPAAAPAAGACPAHSPYCLLCMLACHGRIVIVVSTFHELFLTCGDSSESPKRSRRRGAPQHHPRARDSRSPPERSPLRRTDRLRSRPRSRSPYRQATAHLLFPDTAPSPKPGHFGSEECWHFSPFHSMEGL